MRDVRRVKARMNVLAGTPEQREHAPRMSLSMLAYIGNDKARAKQFLYDTAAIRHVLCLAADRLERNRKSVYVLSFGNYPADCAASSFCEFVATFPSEDFEARASIWRRADQYMRLRLVLTPKPFLPRKRPCAPAPTKPSSGKASRPFKRSRAASAANLHPVNSSSPAACVSITP